MYLHRNSYIVHQMHVKMLQRNQQKCESNRFCSLQNDLYEGKFAKLVWYEIDINVLNFDFFKLYLIYY